MIKQKERGFLLTAGETSLLLSLDKFDHVLTDYFGGKLPDVDDFSPAKRKYGVAFGTATAYRDQEDPNYSLDPLSLDISLPHRGDYNDPSLILRREDGQVFDLVYASSEIRKPLPMEGYPMPRDAEDELVLHLQDEKMAVEVELHYLTFASSEVIGRYMVVKNLSEKPLWIEKAASLQLVLDQDEPFEMVSTYGGWAYELNEEVTPITHTRTIIDSLTGGSSCRHNPFFYLKGKHTSLFHGPCYGFNLIYSGNHFEEVELTSYGKIRIQNGISPTLFEEKLEKNASFLTPLAIFCYSGKGINGLTKIMHDFVNDHIVPERFARKERLIDYNSWEGCMFSFNEGKIKSLMKQAKDAGMELFVLDDGWFGKRDNDSSSLGDWFVNKKKLPHGIDGLSDYCHKLGMKFGLWFEPEMVSPDSDLYRAHPEYAIQDGVHAPTLGRHQLTLDLTKKEVRDYIVSAMSPILKQGVDFVKWDYNRNMSDIPADPGFFHHYILGLYQLLEELSKAFPEILFLNCASGGNRCDLGMLSYFPLTWVSDDTDAFQRTKMQEAMVVGYPQSVFSNHVSSKTNAQTLRKLAIADKFNAASIGILGYELDLNDITKHDEEEIAREVKFYKEHRKTFQYGEYIQFHKLSEENLSVREVLGEKEALLVRTIGVSKPASHPEHLELQGLKEDALYHYAVREQTIDIRRFGPLVNFVSPIHVKEEGVVMNILAKYKEMPIEKFEGDAVGALLNCGAVKLPMSWQGTGYNDDVAFLGDFGSRLYLIQEKE